MVLTSIGPMKRLNLLTQDDIWERCVRFPYAVEGLSELRGGSEPLPVVRVLLCSASVNTL